MNADDDGLLERIYDALDAGEPETAEALVRDALMQGIEDPVLHLLHGVALLDLDRPADAVKALGRAVELDPDDAEARANLALAHFRTRSFDAADSEAKAAAEADPDLPDAHVVQALLAERRGRNDEADQHLARAEKLDPERFPRPVRLSRAEFEAEVVRAGRKLPETFRQHLDAVALTVEDVPSDELLFDGEPPLDPELLGLFVGTALPDLAQFGGGMTLPPRILLFQRNLERHAQDTEDLRDEIAVTVYHELGHYLGLDEVELEEIDLA